MNELLRKYGRVNTGWASRLESDRTFNPNNLICPIPMQSTLDGRDANENTAIMKSAGCFSPLDRMNVENSQRSFYTSNAGLNIENVRDNDDLKVVNMSILNDMNSPYCMNDTKALYNLASRNIQLDYLKRKVIYYKSLSGMTD